MPLLTTVYAAVNAISGEPPPLSELNTVFANIVTVSVALAGLALLFTLITAGFKWTTAQGDPKKLQQAQHTLAFALIGFVLLASAVLILQLIAKFTGVNTILNFSINQP